MTVLSITQDIESAVEELPASHRFLFDITDKNRIQPILFDTTDKIADSLFLFGVTD